MNDILQLLAQIPQLHGQALGDALYDLSKLVKLYEGEKELRPVEQAAPELVKYLVAHPEQQEDWNIDGCTISIFRRIEINNATADKLLALSKTSPCPLLIEAMGHIDRKLWSTEYEAVISQCLEDPELLCAAAKLLWQNSRQISQPDIVARLAGSLNKRPDIYTQGRVISALCSLCNNKKTSKAAQTEIKQLLKTAPKEQRLEIVNTIAWTWSNGDKILALAAEGDDSEVKLAVLENLEKHFKGKGAYFDIAYSLSEQNDKTVKNAALKLLR